jgi:hypothetical protein
LLKHINQVAAHGKTPLGFLTNDGYLLPNPYIVNEFTMAMGFFIKIPPTPKPPFLIRNGGFAVNRVRSEVQWFYWM